MTEQESKRCNRCGCVKPVSEFTPRKNSKNGYVAYCKPCRREIYHETRDTYKRYYQQNRERLIAYASKRARLVGHGGRTSEDARRRHTEDTRQYKRNNTHKGRAHWEVSKAVSAGKLKDPKTLCCANCGGAAVEYHHESYAPEHWLDVIPLCHSCHMTIHSRTRAR